MYTIHMLEIYHNTIIGVRYTVCFYGPGIEQKHGVAIIIILILHLSVMSVCDGRLPEVDLTSSVG